MVLATLAPEGLPTMDQVGQLIGVRAVLAILGLVARDTTDREVHHMKAQVVPSIVALVVLLSMVLVVQHILGLVAAAILGRAVLAIQGLVAREETALRYADDTERFVQAGAHTAHPLAPPLGPSFHSEHLMKKLIFAAALAAIGSTIANAAKVRAPTGRYLRSVGESARFGN